MSIIQKKIFQVLKTFYVLLCHENSELFGVCVNGKAMLQFCHFYQSILKLMFSIIAEVLFLSCRVWSSLVHHDIHLIGTDQMLCW